MNNEVKKFLAEIIKKLKKDYKPLKIILFGSHAYGNPKDDSDLDLLILKNTKRRPVDRFVNVKRIIYQEFSLGILFYYFLPSFFF